MKVALSVWLYLIYSPENCLASLLEDKIIPEQTREIHEKIGGTIARLTIMRQKFNKEMTTTNKS